MLEKFKETLIKRIEQNSVKSELKYKDRDGVEHTEVVYLKRGKGKHSEWHQCYLPINEETKKWHIPNALFGGTRNLIRLLIYLGIFAFFMYAIKEAYVNYETIMNLPCVQNCLNKVLG